MRVRDAKKGEYRHIRNLIKTEPKELEQRGLPRLKDFIVAEAGSKIVGCIALDIDAGRRPEVRSFVVLPAYRKRGVGTLLLEACLAKARKRLRRRKGRIELMAATGRPRLFQGVGFEFTNRRRHFALFLAI